MPTDGRLTSLDTFSGTMAADDLLLVVSPGNASSGVNYKITAAALAAAMLLLGPIVFPTSLTSGGVLYASSTTQVSCSSLLASNAVVVGGGAGTAPSTIASTATSGYVLVAQGAGVAPVWAAASSINHLVVGTSTITGGATTRILYDNAGVLGEYTITGSGTVVAMQTSPRFITDIAPTANDGAAIGTTLLSWSDLFLASGGVINWNAGDVTLTHAADTLTLSGDTLGSLVFAHSGTLDASSTTVASATFAGGVGIAKQLRVGTNIVATGSVEAQNGAANAPSFHWGSDIGNAGLFSPGANIGAVCASGAEIFRWNSSGIECVGYVQAANTSGFRFVSSLFAVRNSGFHQILTGNGSANAIQIDSTGANLYLDQGTLNIRSSGGGTTYGTWSSTTLTVSATTASTSTTTGALVVSGGIGAAGSIWVAAAQTYGIGSTVAVRYNVAGGGSGNWYFGTSGNASASHTGSNNVAVGASAMTLITGAGNSNVAVGSSANNNLTTGAGCMAIGNAAVYYNQTGSNNVGIGTSALSGSSGVSISDNVGIGSTALYNVQSNNNVAIGAAAGYPVSTGASNTFIGIWAGRYNSSASLDTAITGSFNIIIGPYAQIPSATTSAQLNIGGLILATGLSQSTTGALATNTTAIARIVGGLTLDASLSRAAPVTETGATHTVAATTTHLICNRAGTITVTLPSASTYSGREIYIKNIDGTATVVSASSNVCPVTSATAGTAILAATDGAWALLVSDGTNWVIMAQAVS